MQLPAKLDMIDFMTSKGVYIKVVHTFCVVNKAINRFCRTFKLQIRRGTQEQRYSTIISMIFMIVMMHYY
ncbi:MAG: hypothetical protein IGNPGNKH_00838 [Sodalis sp. Ffu]|nr:MAG: hypothetical protein IGNPGNKH_00838 [Sodalis sp. Ffu]